MGGNGLPRIRAAHIRRSPRFVGMGLCFGPMDGRVNMDVQAAQCAGAGEILYCFALRLPEAVRSVEQPFTL